MARIIEGISIGAAAARVGMHPQTIRQYERLGLVRPLRTAGGTRRYTEAHLERLAVIQELTDRGMNLAGVLYVLDLRERIAVLTAERARLVQQLLEAGLTPANTASPGTEIVRYQRSVSMELVHIPRRPRSPRWRNS